jgi:glycosyltransferase involved in cell wall biosynthesis
LIGSKGLGGAERWFQRFCAALAEGHVPATVGIRRGSGLERASSEISDADLPCHRLPFRTVWDPLSRAAVTRLVGRVQPQIVQTYLGRATRLTQRPRFARSSPVHIARLGGYYGLGPYRHADAWIGNTRQLCDWMVAQGLPGARVHQIYNFVDPVPELTPSDCARRRDALGLRSDEWVLVALGRFVPVKGHAYLLDALAHLPVELNGRRWRLLLLGEGPLEVVLRRQAEASGIADRILWLGWWSDPDAYVQLADLVVFPSLEPETLGNVILEAWANARPLVTTACRGAREITRHGEDAWRVPCADSVALAQGIEQVLNDPELANAFAQRGRERVERDFSRDAIMQQYWALYTDLANHG